MKGMLVKQQSFNLSKSFYPHCICNYTTANKTSNAIYNCKDKCQRHIVTSSTASNQEISYLGYRFLLNRKVRSNSVNNKSELHISIAPKKINKIKSRIIKSFFSYSKNKNGNLLKERIEFLSSNFKMKDIRSGKKVYRGLAYNYIEATASITCLEQMDELTAFLRRIVNNPSGRLKKILSAPLPKQLQNDLNKVNFRARFENKWMAEKKTFNYFRILNTCWK